MNKQCKDILLNTAAIFLIVAILKFFITETMMIWVFLFPLQGLITKFFFASNAETEHGVFIDIKSRIKIKHRARHFIIPFVTFFLMVFSVITGFIIADKFKDIVSEFLQILCLLLPFIATRFYLFINKLPLSFLYIFFYHQYNGTIVAKQEHQVFDFSVYKTFMSPVEETLHTKTRKMLDDWDYFYSPNSYVRRYMNDK